MQNLINFLFTNRSGGGLNLVKLLFTAISVVLRGKLKTLKIYFELQIFLMIKTVKLSHDILTQKINCFKKNIFLRITEYLVDTLDPMCFSGFGRVYYVLKCFLYLLSVMAFWSARGPVYPSPPVYLLSPRTLSDWEG